MSPTTQNEPLLLFFQEHEPDRFVKYDRYLLRPLRPAYRRLRGRPAVTGFSMWFKLLRLALVREGYRVEVNNRRLALRNPQWPVGLVGYPSLLDGWDLPNPAILGPAMFDHPTQAPNLMGDDRYRRYLVTCQWMHNLFEPTYGDTVATWHAGIDLDAWPDSLGEHKDVDVLVYDKIRWNRTTMGKRLIQPVLAALERRDLSYLVLRYGEYQHAQYEAALRRSRAMVFLCEHETQGMAYQEAMACNLPVLAWDNGWWLDPARERWTSEPVPASSVPYFSDECGRRFQSAEHFGLVLDEFVDAMGTYQPREFVARELSQHSSAATYARLYAELSG